MDTGGPFAQSHDISQRPVRGIYRAKRFSSKVTSISLPYAGKIRHMSLFDWWRGRGGSAANAQDRQRIDEAVERVVQTTNPKLRFARRYRERLAPAVEASLIYARDLVAQVPPAREASVAAWSGDLYLRAFFATADDLARAFSRAVDLRAYFDQNPQMPEAYATLGMEMTERKILGTAMEGDSIRRDVAQTSVSFGDYKVGIWGRTESDLRAAIERRILDQLALEGLERIAADQSRRAALEQESALLKSRLQLLARQGAGMGAALGNEATAQADPAGLQSQLDENTRNLGSLGGGAALLDHELEHIRSVLAQPEQHFYVSSRRLRLDPMNIVIEDSGAQTGTELQFLQARIPGTTPPQLRAFMLVRFPRADLLPAARLFADAARLVM
jgi:hypothetical protein